MWEHHCQTFLGRITSSYSLNSSELLRTTMLMFLRKILFSSLSSIKSRRELSFLYVGVGPAIKVGKWRCFSTKEAEIAKTHICGSNYYYVHAKHNWSLEEKAKTRSRKATNSRIGVEK